MPLLTKRVWISTSAQRPAAHYVNFMKDDLAETLPQQVQSVFAAASNPPVVVSMRLQGRGSPQDTNQNSSTHTPTNSSIMMGGILLEPLHVLIEASSQDVLSRAEALVDDLVQRAEEATVHPDLLVDSGNTNTNTNNTTTSDSSQSRALVSSSIALATIQDPQSSKGAARTTAYRPASVAQLIGQVNAAESTGQPTTPSGEWVEEELQVPVGVVGLIIGKGGEQIAQLQARTGARVQVQREPTNTNSASPAATHRTVSIAAATQAALDHCKQLILAIVEEKSKTLTGTAGMNRKDAQRLQDAVAAGHVHVTLAVPSDSVGLVIGKGGATIRSLQEQTGAHIQVPSASEAQDGQRTLHITHPQRAGAEQAQRLIQDLVQQHTAAQTHHKALPGSGVYGSSSNPAPAVNPVTATDPQVTATMLIPDADVGLIIGRQGVVIRYLQDSTGAQIQIPPECHYPGSHERLTTLTGTATACRQAQAKLGQIIADQSSAGVMAQASPSAGGGAGAGHYGNYYSYPGTAAAGAAGGNKSDGYSAEWAAYHAAQQAAAAAAAAAPPTTTTTAPYYGGASSTASYPSYGYPQQQAQAQQQSQPYAPPQQQQGGGAPTTSSTTNPTNTTATTTAAAPSGPAAATSATVATTPGTTTTTPTVTAGATQPAVSVASGTTATTTTATTTTPASDAYYEQFFRYAYYYGEPAARQYYGPHWSPPVGTANPYGVNPNLPATATTTTAAATGTAPLATTTTLAPTAPMTTTTTTAISSSGPITTATPAASQPPPQQRETSVRKVSNLPAWMNKGT